MSLSKLYLFWQAELFTLPPEAQNLVHKQIELYLKHRFNSNISKSLNNEIFLSIIENYDNIQNSLNTPQNAAIFNLQQKILKQFINSETLQKNYIKTKYIYIEPEPISTENDYGWMVDPSKLLQHALSDETIKQLILNEKKIIKVEDDGWTCNIPDLCGARHDLAGSLRMVLGADDIRPHHSSNKKYLMIYMDLSNIPIELRRNENSGYTLAILDREKIKEFFGDSSDPLQSALEPIISRLKSVISNGIFHDQDHFEVKLFAVCSDNLGAHELIGISMNFSKGFKCRSCPITTTGLNDKHTALWWINREFSIEIEDHPNTRRDFAFKPIPGTSQLSLIPYDVFHDLAQGVGEIVLTEEIFPCIGEENLTPIIQNTKFLSGNVKVFFKGTKARFSKNTTGMAKLEVLERFFEIFHQFLHYFDEDMIKLMESLVNLCSMIFSYDLKFEDIDKVEKLSKKIYFLFKKMKIKIRPKMHNLIHYKQHLLFFGRLQYFNTCRYERLHQTHIRIIRMSKNSINVPKSMLMNFQYKLAMRKSLN